MALRDGLAAGQIPAFNDATAAFLQEYADACAERDELAATGGTRAVAEAAWYPGHPLVTVDEIQRRYEQMQDEARHRADAA